MTAFQTRRPATLAVLILLAVAASCQTTREAYYNAWENFGGYAKRERLVDNVKAVSAAQNEAKQQFTSALEQFKSVVNYDGGDLEKMYNKLNKEYEASADQADEVRGKIQSVRNVGTALFDEWKGEISEITDASLKGKSQALFDATRADYDQLLARMDAAAKAMDPVLVSFKDRVLFIKSNLNAQAIASLRGTEMQLGQEIDGLIREMEASIAEADRFIQQMESKG
jgi:ABC-type transporter Mla subunit MlaD